MANDSRAWQRPLKNGKTEVYAAVAGRVSVRITGQRDDCLALVRSVEEITGVAVTLADHGPPIVHANQIDIYEVLGR